MSFKYLFLIISCDLFEMENKIDTEKLFSFKKVISVKAAFAAASCASLVFAFQAP